jgi:hypothetical protein
VPKELDSLLSREAEISRYGENFEKDLHSRSMAMQALIKGETGIDRLRAWVSARPYGGGVAGRALGSKARSAEPTRACVKNWHRLITQVFAAVFENRGGLEFPKDRFEDGLFDPDEPSWGANIKAARFRRMGQFTSGGADRRTDQILDLEARWAALREEAEADTLTQKDAQADELLRLEALKSMESAQLAAQKKEQEEHQMKSLLNQTDDDYKVHVDLFAESFKTKGTTQVERAKGMFRNRLNWVRDGPSALVRRLQKAKNWGWPLSNGQRLWRKTTKNKDLFDREGRAREIISTTKGRPRSGTGTGEAGEIWGGGGFQRQMQKLVKEVTPGNQYTLEEVGKDLDVAASVEFMNQRKYKVDQLIDDAERRDKIRLSTFQKKRNVLYRAMVLQPDDDMEIARKNIDTYESIADEVGTEPLMIDATQKLTMTYDSEPLWSALAGAAKKMGTDSDMDRTVHHGMLRRMGEEQAAYDKGEKDELVQHMRDQGHYVDMADQAIAKARTLQQGHEGL